MSHSTRRRFLKQATLGLTAATLATPRRSRAAQSGDRIRVGVIGCGNQGKAHLRALTSLPDVRVQSVCDVDPERLQTGVDLSGGAQPVTDLRRILDDRAVDAVTIATPDHWHTPLALMALEAGKHVYVEKPCCHNVREGQLLRDRAAQSGKAVAHGTQARSSPSMQQAMTLLREGVIGDVLQAKCWNWQLRKDIGRLQPSSPPPGVDYDTWVGPAEWMPFQANRFHYDWHWWYNFGCGGFGNDGIHEFDYALWGLGAPTHPTLISAAGGKYFFDDDQQFPDTQQVTFEFADDGGPGERRMLVYEQRLWSTNYPFHVDSGAEFFGTKGKMFISKRGKFEVRGERNVPLEIKLDNPPKSEVVENMRNWLDCTQSGDSPNANMDIAVRTAVAVHLGNLATRLRRTLHFDPASEQLRGDDEAAAMLGRKYRAEGHWGIPPSA